MMRTGIRYLKERMKIIVLYLVFSGIFLVVFALYDIRLDAVGYAFLLALVLMLGFGGSDFCRYYKRARQLEEAKERILVNPACLPEADGRIEELYQQIVTRLEEEMTELESSIRISRQEMKDYYGMWVHQIKTPISALHVLMQSETETAESGLKIRAMRQELFKIEQYVEMVLTYLRMEEMGADLVFKQYSLDEIVKQAVRKYSQMFILKKIRLDYEPLNTEVITDEKWLLFVIEQILSNALKYTKKGSIHIYMEGGNLVIEDTGIGIWPEDLPRVFEKGFTGYNGRTDKKSTGIGLYLCKSVLTKMNHQIRLESEVDRGTKVYLGLERKKIRME